MAKGRAVAVMLDDAEKVALTALIRKHGAPQSLALRARIVLAAAEGLTNREIAMHLNVCAHTVGVWRNRFACDGLDGLYDEPRPGAPRQIGDDEIAATIRKTLETRPQGATHWSLRTMAKAVGHSPSTIHRFFALLTDRAIRCGVFRSVADLERAITAYIDTNNADPKPFRWTKSADDILASIQRFYLRSLTKMPKMKTNSESGH
ncbi:helix-turn-helix domain-containing protein [Acidocella aminolytica]|uniref:Transposase n=1 Tax=Acidocella aminolytica 101 = DSM 11237 TaxID=1120923 RepID=A0A0D6PLK8_9PROT|nr:helix-turn-helix domain-containing protein [Acidocella aminolytica]GAN82103.1 transposase [Acidocella aminolytica 101 = DSM 11237]GBQ39187.1 transposase [Acidocella aminolytica 101 = DSM 11237]